MSLRETLPGCGPWLGVDWQKLIKLLQRDVCGVIQLNSIILLSACCQYDSG